MNNNTTHAATNIANRYGRTDALADFVTATSICQELVAAAAASPNRIANIRVYHPATRGYIVLLTNGLVFWYTNRHGTEELQGHEVPLRLMRYVGWRA